MNKSNFDFLKGVNDFIYAIACAAENNYPDDPNTTLIKMRMFGEATARPISASCWIYRPAKTSLTCCANWARLRLLMTASFLFSISRAVSVTWPSTFHNVWTMPRCACGSGSASASGTTGW